MRALPQPAGWNAWLAGFDDRPASDDPSPVVFVVRPDASAAAIGEDLERRRIIRSATAFRVHAELRGVGGRLGVGEYELRRNMGVGEILDALAAGRVRRGLVTIPEGWRAEEIAQHLEASGVADASAFMRVVSAVEPGALVPLPPGALSFEGYLFPESYDFGQRPAPEAVLRTLIGEFERRVDGGLRARAEERGLSVHQLVTLASIVEREGGRPEERARISAVFHNRLVRRMPLQADPTAQYALVPFGTLLDRPYWKRELSSADLAVDSPYNTYRAAGLPPGPISNPGLDSIRAAAEPADGPWLYFVARGDGSHLFAETLSEHLQNVARAR